MSVEPEGHLLTRRTLLRGAAAAGIAAVPGLPPGCRSSGGSGSSADRPPETTTIRMNINPFSYFAAHAISVHFLKENYINEVGLATVVAEDLRMMPFNVWRQYDPADTMNFYSLRLREAGLIRSTPEQIISRATDFRYLHQLRQELKP